MRRPSITLRILALAAVLFASCPAASEACLFYPCGIFGWRCRNYGYAPSYGAPPVVPTSQAVYPPVYAAPAPVYAAPAPRPCPPPCPPPRCVPVCPPCQPVCPPCPRVCEPVCPSVCPSSCGPVYSSSINCQYGTRTTNTTRYAPVTAYRRELYSVPVTSYRSVPIYNPQSGLTTTYRPVTTFYRRVQMAPYNTYRVVSPGYSTGGYGAGVSAPAGGCASGACGTGISGSVSSAQPTPASQGEVSKNAVVGSLPGVTPRATRTPTEAAPKEGAVVERAPASQPSLPPASPATNPRGRLPIYAPPESGDGPRLPEGTPRTTQRDEYDPTWAANALRGSAAKVRQAAWSEEPAVSPPPAPSTVREVDGETVDFGGWRPAR